MFLNKFNFKLLQLNLKFRTLERLVVAIKLKFFPLHFINTYRVSQNAAQKHEKINVYTIQHRNCFNLIKKSIKLLDLLWKWLNLIRKKKLKLGMRRDSIYCLLPWVPKLSSYNPAFRCQEYSNVAKRVSRNWKSTEKKQKQIFLMHVWKEKLDILNATNGAEDALNFIQVFVSFVI